MSTFPKIVNEYRQTHNLTLRAFAAALSEHHTASFSHQTILNWETGATTPNPLDLIVPTYFYSDWRHDFLCDCLAALMPDIYQPAGKIGRTLLQAPV